MKRLQGFAQIIISLPPSEEQLTRIGSGNDEVVVGVVIQALVNRRLDLSHIGARGIDLNEIPKSVAGGHCRPGAEMRLRCSDLLKSDASIRRCIRYCLIHYNIGISTGQRRGSHRVGAIVSRATGDGEGNPVDELQGMIPVDLEGLGYNDCAENRIVQLVVPMRVIPIGKLPRVATVCATAGKGILALQDLGNEIFCIRLLALGNRRHQRHRLIFNSGDVCLMFEKLTRGTLNDCATAGSGVRRHGRCSIKELCAGSSSVGRAVVRDGVAIPDNLILNVLRNVPCGDCGIVSRDGRTADQVPGRVSFPVDVYRMQRPVNRRIGDGLLDVDQRICRGQGRLENIEGNSSHHRVGDDPHHAPVVELCRMVSRDGKGSIGDTDSRDGVGRRGTLLQPHDLDANIRTKINGFGDTLPSCSSSCRGHGQRVFVGITRTEDIEANVKAIVIKIIACRRRHAGERPGDGLIAGGALRDGRGHCQDHICSQIVSGTKGKQVGIIVVVGR